MSTATSSSFQAWRVDQQEDGSFHGSEQTMTTESLPHATDGVLIHVSHSSLNYKDAGSASGNKGITRNFPHTPGIDAIGTLVETGEPVLVTGYDLGMNTPGGFGQRIRVPKEWILQPLPLPFQQDPRKAMIYGTAGLTAALCVQKLLHNGHAKPAQGKVVVTGASGAVGSVAVELLAKLGFDVVAISGKILTHKETLLKLGAKQVMGREVLAESTKKPLLKPTFAHAIDTVGGTPLSELLKQIQPGGSVACCGLVAGAQLETTVLPFILRGIQLLGVDSVEIPLPEKKIIWDKLATSWACPVTESLAVDIGRHQLDEYLQAFLKGESVGKVVLDHSIVTNKKKTTTNSRM
jgi:acrylyl-CoA reductase (NADPH)